MSIKLIFDLDYTLYSNNEVNDKTETTFYKSFKKKHLLNHLLHQVPYKKYIFSNGNKLHVDDVIKKMKLKSFFFNTATSDEYKGNLKPNINSYNYVIKKFKIKPEDTIVFFEDSLANLQIAKKYFNWITIYINNKESFSGKNKYSFVDFTFTTIEDAVYFLSQNNFLKIKNDLKLINHRYNKSQFF